MLPPPNNAQKENTTKTSLGQTSESMPIMHIIAITAILVMTTRNSVNESLYRTTTPARPRVASIRAQLTGKSGFEPVVSRKNVPLKITAATSRRTSTA